MRVKNKSMKRRVALIHQRPAVTYSDNVVGSAY